MIKKPRVVDEQPRCAFCRKTEAEVGKLFGAPLNKSLSKPLVPPVYICAACVEVCNGILGHQDQGKPPDRS